MKLSICIPTYEPVIEPEDIPRDLELNTQFSAHSRAYHAAQRTSAACAYAPPLAEAKLSSRLSPEQHQRFGNYSV